MAIVSTLSSGSLRPSTTAKPVPIVVRVDAVVFVVVVDAEIDLVVVVAVVVDSDLVTLDVALDCDRDEAGVEVLVVGGGCVAVVAGHDVRDPKTALKQR